MDLIKKLINIYQGKPEMGRASLWVANFHFASGTKENKPEDLETAKDLY